KVLVPAQQGRGGRPQRLLVQGPLQVQQPRRDVHVHAALIVEGLEEQPLLERREREDVVETGCSAHRPCLSSASSSSISSWLSEPSSRSEGVCPPASAPSAWRTRARRARNQVS